MILNFSDATGDECFFKDIQRPVDWIVGYRTGLSVSDLINQFWCEQQFEYSFTHPLSYPIPKTVATGAEIHKERGMCYTYDQKYFDWRFCCTDVRIIVFQRSTMERGL